MNSAGRSPGNRGPSSFFSRRAHLLTTCKTGGGMPAASCALRGGLRLLRQPPDNATAPAGGAAVIVCAIGQIPSLQPTLFLQPPAQTCHRQLCRRDGRASCPSIFSFAKEKQKKGIEVNETWQFIIWKRRWSVGAQGALLWPIYWSYPVLTISPDFNISPNFHWQELLLYSGEASRSSEIICCLE